MGKGDWSVDMLVGWMVDRKLTVFARRYGMFHGMFVCENGVFLD